MKVSMQSLKMSSKEYPTLRGFGWVFLEGVSWGQSIEALLAFEVNEKILVMGIWLLDPGATLH